MPSTSMAALIVMVVQKAQRAAIRHHSPQLSKIRQILLMQSNTLRYNKYHKENLFTLLIQSTPHDFFAHVYPSQFDLLAATIA